MSSICTEILDSTKPVEVGETKRLKVLFALEGFTDIRFLVGLSEICDLTVATPSRQYRESGLHDRLVQSGVNVKVHEIDGGRLRYQLASFAYLWKEVQQFDVVLSQEVLRGSLNSCLIGKLKRIPVLTYMCIAPVEYFRCRSERRECGAVKARIGEAVIRSLMWMNGKLAAGCIAMGPYLQRVAARSFGHVVNGLYYGVDTELYKPVNSADRERLRRELRLPNKFLILLSSRISHEKDPETVLRAVALARSRGLDAVLINLGGGFERFLKLAKDLHLSDADAWVLGRPAAHPMHGLEKYYQAVDCLAQASLSEGAGMSPVEALACGTPAVCTAVGGLAEIPKGYARLVPRRDHVSMADEFLRVAAHREEARRQALDGRAFVKREWSRSKAFGDLANILASVVRDK